MMGEPARPAGGRGRCIFAASLAAFVLVAGGAFATARHRPLTFQVGAGPYYAATAVSLLPAVLAPYRGWNASHSGNRFPMPALAPLAPALACGHLATTARRPAIAAPPARAGHPIAP